MHGRLAGHGSVLQVSGNQKVQLTLRHGRVRNLRASPHFTEISLERSFDCERSDLPPLLRPPDPFVGSSGLQVIRGIPFLFGSATGQNVVLLDRTPVSVELGGALRFELTVLPPGVRNDNTLPQVTRI
jgi:hypothetical protein